MRNQRPHRAILAAVMIASLAVSGCAGSEQDPESAPTADASPTPETTVSESPEPADEESTEPSPTEEQEPTPSAEATSQGIPEGWQEIRLKGGVGYYGLPPEWEPNILDPDGKETEVSVYQRGYCETDPKRALGGAIPTWTKDAGDVAEVVEKEIHKAAENFFGKRDPEVTIGGENRNGPWAAALAGVKLAPSDDPCDPAEAAIGIKGATYPDGSGTLLFIVVGEFGLPESPHPEDIPKILNSMAGNN